jgi:hypothetical protein
MGQGAGIPLKDRAGPNTADPGVAPPPGTRCWVSLPDGGRAGGVVLGWQQAPDRRWHALVSVWLPAETVARREAP